MKSIVNICLFIVLLFLLVGCPLPKDDIRVDIAKSKTISGFDGPTKIELSGNMIYVLDSKAGNIYKIDISTIDKNSTNDENISNITKSTISITNIPYKCYNNSDSLADFKIRDFDITSGASPEKIFMIGSSSFDPDVNSKTFDTNTWYYGFSYNINSNINIPDDFVKAIPINRFPIQNSDAADTTPIPVYSIKVIKGGLYMTSGGNRTALFMMLDPDYTVNPQFLPTSTSGDFKQLAYSGIIRPFNLTAVNYSDGSAGIFIISKDDPDNNSVYFYRNPSITTYPKPDPDKSDKYILSSPEVRSMSKWVFNLVVDPFKKDQMFICTSAENPENNELIRCDISKPLSSPETKSVDSNFYTTIAFYEDGSKALGFRYYASLVANTENATPGVTKIYKLNTNDANVTFEDKNDPICINGYINSAVVYKDYMIAVNQTMKTIVINKIK